MTTAKARADAAKSFFNALHEVGQKPEDAIPVWKGATIGYEAMFKNSLGRSMSDKVKIDSLWEMVWNEAQHPMAEIAMKAMAVGDTDNMGLRPKEEVLLWLRAFVALDYKTLVVLQRELGMNTAYEYYTNIWEQIALGGLPVHQKILGEGPIDLEYLGKLGALFWESIACPYSSETTDDSHYGTIHGCAYWENMKAMFGEEEARSMTAKILPPCSINYYDTILKELGVEDEFRADMTKFICVGDDVCTQNFHKKK